MVDKKKAPKIEDLKKKDLDPKKAEGIKGGRARSAGDDDDLEELEVQR